ncbi:Na+/H+ antiporter subunit E [Actinomadura atramentaria]|uniref:Na+/H+ antiporter subunit E n=1 Tax=Actinomadura atramentaria TaxID=1990 RepID=UPI000360F004|nr:Na+/H+ antiporter subunit E [Actinomadura atramentaria]
MDTRAAAAVGAAAAACFALYWALLSATTGPQLVVGAGVAVAAALAGRAAARALTGPAPRPAGRRLAAPARAAVALPVQILWDARWLVLPTPRGEHATFRFPEPGGPDRTGLVTLLLSAAPGTFVTRVDAERGEFTVHRLASRPDLVERGLRR